MVAAGDPIYASDINGRGIQYRANRTASAGPTSGTTFLGVLRIDGMVLKAGFIYEFKTSGLRPTFTAVGGYKADLRYNASGTATTSSTEIGRVETNDNDGAGGDSWPGIVGYVVPGTDTTAAGVILSIARFSGTGTVSLPPDTGGVHIIVTCLGPDPGDTGIDV